MQIQTDHPAYPGPAADKSLWRYMGLTKFLSLVTSEALYLPSVQSLRTDDPFEGFVTHADYLFYAHLRDDPTAAEAYFRDALDSAPDQSNRAQIRQQLLNTLDPDHFQTIGSERCFVSCWHAKEHESAALWKLYSRDEDGIAIRTTVQSLMDSLKDASPETNAILGNVRYIDFQKHHLQDHNIFDPVFHKRNSFEHEAEVRLAFWQPPDHPGQALTPIAAGVLLPCKVRTLLKEVFISPYAPEWCVQSVAAVLVKLGVTAPIRQSQLLERPLQAKARDLQEPLTLPLQA